MANISPCPVICFIDVDAFECQLYQRDEPEYRGKPCVVANSSGRILAATYEAKALGVNRKSTPRVDQAKKVCPSIHVFWKKDVWGKQDSKKTRHASYELVDCVNGFFKNSNDVIVELASSDELFVDVSAEVTRGMRQRKEMEALGLRPPRTHLPIPERVIWEKYNPLQGPFNYKLPNPRDPRFREGRQYLYQRELTVERLMFGSLLLNQLLETIQKETKLEAAGGVGSNRLLAKVGCGLNKPRKITVCPHYAVWDEYTNSYPGKRNPLYPGNGIDCLASRIPITDIPGLKALTGERLMETFGIKTMNEIQSIPFVKMEEIFGLELAHQIFNWSKGEDNQPVQSKQMKESIRCNKPADRKIRNFKSLENSIRDLCEEITILLDEERDRHKRTVPSVRVEFATQNNKSEFEEFNISKPSGLKSLPKTILTFFNSQLKGGSFEITQLSLSVKNFEPIESTGSLRNGSTNVDKDVVTLSGALAQIMLSSNNKRNPPAPNGPSNFLKLHPNKETGVRLTFLGQVGAFRTTVQGTSLTDPKDVTLPKLLSSNKLESFREYKLPEFEEIKKPVDSAQLPHVVITNHAFYYEMKHKSFVNWVLEHKYGEYLHGDNRNVDFVSFHGRIADTLLSPHLRKGKSWEIYGINVANVIYLWDEKVPKPQPPVNNVSFGGLAFEKLVTESPQNGQVIEEMDKLYFVDKLQLGSHRLLLITQVDAQTPDTNERVQISLHAKKYKNPEIHALRNYHLYAQCLTTGCNTAVVGTRTRNTLHDVRIFSSLEKFVEEKQLGNVQECIEFQNRLLSWIRLHLPESNENTVKKFSWVSGGRDVKVSNFPELEIPGLVVPRLYSKYFETIQKKASK